MSKKTADELDAQGFAKRIAVTGIWTPWAQVLCMRCHGPSEHHPSITAKDIEAHSKSRFFRAPPDTYVDSWGDRERQVSCDKCGCNIWVSGDPGKLAEIRDYINARGDKETSPFAALEQTGGMCCALRVMEGEGNHRNLPTVMITALDGPYTLGRYFPSVDLEPEELEEYMDLPEKTPVFGVALKAVFLLNPYRVDVPEWSVTTRQVGYRYLYFTIRANSKEEASILGELVEEHGWEPCGPDPSWGPVQSHELVGSVKVEHDSDEKAEVVDCDRVGDSKWCPGDKLGGRCPGLPPGKPSDCPKWQPTSKWLPDHPDSDEDS